MAGIASDLTRTSPMLPRMRLASAGSNSPAQGDFTLAKFPPRAETRDVNSRAKLKLAMCTWVGVVGRRGEC